MYALDSSTATMITVTFILVVRQGLSRSQRSHHQPCSHRKITQRPPLPCCLLLLLRRLLRQLLPRHLQRHLLPYRPLPPHRPQHQHQPWSLQDPRVAVYGTSLQHLWTPSHQSQLQQSPIVMPRVSQLQSPRPSPKRPARQLPLRPGTSHRTRIMMAPVTTMAVARVK